MNRVEHACNTLPDYMQKRITAYQNAKRYKEMHEREKDVQNGYDEFYVGKASFSDDINIPLGVNPMMEFE